MRFKSHTDHRYQRQCRLEPHTIIPGPFPADSHVFWNTVLVSKIMISQDNNLVKAGYYQWFEVFIIHNTDFIAFSPSLQPEQRGAERNRCQDLSMTQPPGTGVL